MDFPLGSWVPSSSFSSSFWQTFLQEEESVLGAQNREGGRGARELLTDYRGKERALIACWEQIPQGRRQVETPRRVREVGQEIPERTA